MEKKVILFQGDSITDCLRDRNNLYDLAKGYPNLVMASLNLDEPYRYTAINKGISGNRIADLYARDQMDIINLKPDYLSILIGINDVWRQFDTPAMRDRAVSPTEYEQYVENMLLSLQGRVKGVFLMTPYYMEPNKDDWMRARMDEYSAICRKLAEKYACIFIDTQAMFDRYFKHQHSAYIAWDRVHPNQIGATLIAREFLKHCDFDYNHEA